MKDGAEPNVPVTPRKPLAVTMQVDSHAGMKIVVKTDPGLHRADRAGPAGRHHDGHGAGFPGADRAGLCRQAVAAPESSARPGTAFFGKQ